MREQVMSAPQLRSQSESTSTERVASMPQALGLSQRLVPLKLSALRDQKGRTLLGELGVQGVQGVLGVVWDPEK